MTYKRPADREVNRGAQERPDKPNPVNNGPETRKPSDKTGIDKPIPDTHGTDMGGQFDE